MLVAFIIGLLPPTSGDVSDEEQWPISPGYINDENTTSENGEKNLFADYC